MSDIKLYHYTSIEKLALILQNKTLRFNRIDKVNDPQASEYYQVKLPGKRFYVSCWTKNAEESIPMWQLYAGAAEGVRIEAVENNSLQQSLMYEAEKELKN